MRVASYTTRQWFIPLWLTISRSEIRATAVKCVPVRVTIPINRLINCVAREGSPRSAATALIWLPTVLLRWVFFFLRCDSIYAAWSRSHFVTCKSKTARGGRSLIRVYAKEIRSRTWSGNKRERDRCPFICIARLSLLLRCNNEDLGKESAKWP